MEFTEEMVKMLDVLKDNDEKLRDYNSLRKSYLAPNIPDKVMKKLIKGFDKQLPVNSVLGFYDSSLFNNCKSGIIFTTDGLYDFFAFGATRYTRYVDIAEVTTERDNIGLKTRDGMTHTVYGDLHKDTFSFVLKMLIDIDKKYGQTSKKTSGDVVKKIKLPDDIQKKCHLIIHGASVAAGGVGTGLAQLPCADNAVITPIQVGMIVSLGKVFDLELTDAAASVVLTSVGAGFVGRAVSQVLVGWIPGVGNVINTATAAGLTEAIGWTVAADFYNKWCEGDARLEGMKSGYAEASDVYESKLRDDAEKFFNETKDFKKEYEEFQRLLDEYEELIKNLQERNAELERIYAAREVYERLCRLQQTDTVGGE